MTEELWVLVAALCVIRGAKHLFEIEDGASFGERFFVAVWGALLLYLGIACFYAEVL